MRGVLLGGYEAYGQGKNGHVRVWDVDMNWVLGCWMDGRKPIAVAEFGSLLTVSRIVGNISTTNPSLAVEQASV
jgi:hypothetical protein